MGNIIKNSCSSQQPVSSIITLQQPSKIQNELAQLPPEEQIKEPKTLPTPIIEPIIEPRPPTIDQRIQKNCIYKACQKQNQEQEFIKTNCEKGCYFHQTCFEDHLKYLIQEKKFCLKCKCETKMNTSFLRFCQIPNRMILLTQLFEKQLDEIRYSTKTIRDDAETQEYIDKNRMASELNDYFLYPEETLEYEETPQ